MICCSINITPFASQLTTSVPYSGEKPTVSILYLQPDGSFLVAGVFTSINITPTHVQVDHGGLQSGYIKLLQ